MKMFKNWIRIQGSVVERSGWQTVCEQIAESRVSPTVFLFPAISFWTQTQVSTHFVSTRMNPIVYAFI